uniref:Uncharacterized protein n=1 Tax=Rhizophora mucronata TaxID=61149 RepID=A0A2P2N633_RHIMU
MDRLELGYRWLIRISKNKCALIYNFWIISRGNNSEPDRTLRENYFQHASSRKRANTGEYRREAEINWKAIFILKIHQRIIKPSALLDLPADSLLCVI